MTYVGEAFGKGWLMFWLARLNVFRARLCCPSALFCHLSGIFIPGLPSF